VTKPSKKPIADEATDYRILSVIEEMVKRNCSEREIAQTVRKLAA
jgi:hypothetical protein